jgi:prepilin signal peptidase PulO-like enzyme (type II secretory pathway)
MNTGRIAKVHDGAAIYEYKIKIASAKLLYGSAGHLQILYSLRQDHFELLFGDVSRASKAPVISTAQA